MTERVATHNGTLTVVNPATGGRRTFKISTVKNGNLKGKRILSLLTGPNNEEDYRGFAFVTESGRVNVWRKHLGTELEKLGRFVECLDAYRESHGIEVLWAGTCRRCNRKLTTPESINTGIGPICAGKV